MSQSLLTWLVSLLILALMGGVGWIVGAFAVRRFTARHGGGSLVEAVRIATALRIPRQLDVRKLAKSVSRRALRLRLELPGRRTVLPSAVTVGCSDRDYELLEPVRGIVGEAIAEHLVSTARERNWIVLGTPTVTVVRDDQAPDGVPLLSATYDERAARRHLATVRPGAPAQPGRDAGAGPGGTPGTQSSGGAAHYPPPAPSGPEPTRAAPPAGFGKAAGPGGAIPPPAWGDPATRVDPSAYRGSPPPDGDAPTRRAF
jgi:hypothetical protein